MKKLEKKKYSKKTQKKGKEVTENEKIQRTNDKLKYTMCTSRRKTKKKT